MFMVKFLFIDLRILLITLITHGAVCICAQDKMLTKNQVMEDLDVLTELLNQKSSYVYLNGYDFRRDFENYRKNLKDSASVEDLGMFLTASIGKIGDRHSNVRGYHLKDSLYLPFAYAPIGGKVLVLRQNKDVEYEILYPQFPYLKAINGIDINLFLSEIVPKDIKAPKEAYFKNAVRNVNAVQRNYVLLHKDLPRQMRLTLTNAEFQNDTVLTLAPILRSEKLPTWDDKFSKEYGLLKSSDYNKPEVISRLFSLKEEIAYIHVPAMIGIKSAPLLLEKLQSFMASIKNESKALIVDVRDNGGGTRDLTYEFAKYFIHPDSVYIVNVTQQRGTIPLSDKLERRLESRRLFPRSVLDANEIEEANKFLKTFRPIYDLPKEKYSEYHFGIFNGKKRSEQSFYYDKPIYILANERTFSAASVFVSVFKGIPNIKIAGVRTDGSSGNNEPFSLPNSELTGRISTMVSFQKNGKTLDTYGTEPDIPIERDEDQILGKRDTQLEKLQEIILSGN